MNIGTKLISNLTKIYELSILPVSFVFFSCCTLCGIIFLNLAQKWPGMMKIWYENERRLLTPEYRFNRWKLTKTIKFAVITVLVAAFCKKRGPGSFKN